MTSYSLQIVMNFFKIQHWEILGDNIYEYICFEVVIGDGWVVRAIAMLYHDFM